MVVNSRPWTAEEEDMLRVLYADLEVTQDELQDAFPGRTKNAITLKANKLGVYRIPLHEARFRALMREAEP